MRDLIRLRSVCVLTSVTALTVGAAAITPGAVAAGALQKCGNIKVSYPQEVEQGKTKTLTLPVKNVSTEGVTCRAAFKFIKLQYSTKTGIIPEKYKCTTGHFKVPVGFVPEVCTRGKAKIQYGAQGG